MKIFRNDRKMASSVGEHGVDSRKTLGRHKTFEVCHERDRITCHHQFAWSFLHRSFIAMLSMPQQPQP
jgi:hypothetical protein